MYTVVSHPPPPESLQSAERNAMLDVRKQTLIPEPKNEKKAQRNHVVRCLGSGRACDGVGLGRDFSVPENGFGAARTGRGDDIKHAPIATWSVPCETNPAWTNAKEMKPKTRRKNKFQESKTRLACGGDGRIHGILPWGFSLRHGGFILGLGVLGAFCCASLRGGGRGRVGVAAIGLGDFGRGDFGGGGRGFSQHGAAATCRSF